MSKPNALFSIFCVLSSASDILGRAARLQAKQSYVALRSRIPLKEDISVSPEDADSEPIIEQSQPIPQTTETVSLPQREYGGHQKKAHVPLSSEAVTPLAVPPIHAPQLDTSILPPLTLTPDSDMTKGIRNPLESIDETDFAEPEVCYT